MAGLAESQYIGDAIARSWCWWSLTRFRGHDQSRAMQLFGLNMFDPKVTSIIQVYIYDFIYSLSIFRPFRPSASFCEALFDALSTVSSLLISSSKSQVTCPWVGRNNTNGARMKSVQIWAFALLDSTRCLKVQLLSCCGVCGAAKTHFCFDDVATEGTCLLLLVHFSVLNSENDSPHN